MYREPINNFILRPVFHVRDIVREIFALVQLCVYVSMCAISRARDFSYAILPAREMCLQRACS